MMTWFSGNGIVHISQVTWHRARLVPRLVTVGVLSRYLTIHLGQLSLATLP